MPVETTTYKDVLASVRHNYPTLVVISCIGNILLLVTSIYMLQIYDRVLTSGSLDTLLWLTALALFAIAIYGVLEQSRRLILSRSAGYIESELASPVLKRLLKTKVAGGEAEAGIRDVSDLRAFYQSDAALAFLDAPWSIVFLLFIWALHPFLGVIATLGAVVLLIASIANDRMTRARQKEAALKVRQANELALHYLDGAGTISPLGMTDAIFDRWQAFQNEARSEQQALGETTTSVLSFTRSLRLALQITILGTGAYLVLQGAITAGAMIASSIVSGRAFAPLERVTAAWARYVAAKAANERLRKLFQMIGDDAEPLRLPQPKGQLDVESISCLAPRGGKLILSSIGFALNAGEVCAVTGPSGAGKSTLCKMLVGAWKPAKGNVRLDGADVFEWGAEQLGPHIGYLPQKVELFPGTIAENIARFGALNSEAVIAAAKAADVHDLILRLPKGYETAVGQSGNMLSSGQRQRIALARALFGDPSLIVLDEPNSNLDREGDQALVAALMSLKARKRTVIIVSHRAEVLKTADKMLLLQDGHVVSFGDMADMLQPVKPVSPPNAPAQQPKRPSRGQKVVAVKAAQVKGS
ncbi:type I secretion system permease/ATPase [Celeribacter litoreus]|uniref:type I secretion system permease/ATPase n=1 Tax=Celeribacter litoreus TaxID=2876714 RepID=UPI001CCEC484|nr:type I secretion system permease/ATPase [Celeribacter litoreus]MCA0043147.1 type I secretion system permease/ATPase [Celeribacter litoreus]